MGSLEVATNAYLLTNTTAIAPLSSSTLTSITSGKCTDVGAGTSVDGKDCTTSLVEPTSELIDASTSSALVISCGQLQRLVTPAKGWITVDESGQPLDLSGVYSISVNCVSDLF
jgi:hypothetical protein